MTNAAVPTTINPGGAVSVLLLYNVLAWQSIRLTFGEITGGTALIVTLIGIFSVVIVAGLLLHLRDNLNRYWDSLAGAIAEDARIGVGEVVFAVLGLLLWADTFATLLNPSYHALGS